MIHESCQIELTLKFCINLKIKLENNVVDQILCEKFVSQASFECTIKVATKNRQKRQLAKFRQSAKTKLVEGQILCEKLVS